MDIYLNAVPTVQEARCNLWMCVRVGHSRCHWSSTDSQKEAIDFPHQPDGLNRFDTIDSAGYLHERGFIGSKGEMTLLIK